MTSADHRTLANAIRALAMDAVEKANSGHPGMPMGMADVATVLYQDVLKFDPAHPEWPDRDRFILSAGHGSMLQYALLYLTGTPGMTIEEIKNFRQLGAKTAGHPEYGHAPGIETTTGPLGQGLANAVGMALAERMLAARFGEDIVDHHTYVIAGDGCLMEGISQEAISLAGHLKLSRLIVLFDDNKISIDGPTSLTVSEDTPLRFKACGWDVQSIDGHDPKAILEALQKAKQTDTPSLIACRTTIGYGAPKKAGTASCHGAALGKEEVEGARAALGWNYPPFEIPSEVLSVWRGFGERGKQAFAAWTQRLDAHAQREEFERLMRGDLPHGWSEGLYDYKKKAAAMKPQATRKSSQDVLEILNAAIPEMVGGSADLTGSNNTKTSQMKPVMPPSSLPPQAGGVEKKSPPQAGGTEGGYAGRYIYYGVREHAMGAVMNGLALHQGFIPYGGTFLVFTDYCKPAIRLSALMHQRVVYVMTHDSIGLGEDGPTHQPVEHLAALRAIPNLWVFRPADAVETAECWQIALDSKRTPSVLALSRQNLPIVRLEYTEKNLCSRGGYILSPADGKAKATLVATGSEVEIALAAQKLLEAEGMATTVVSMPCKDLFEIQDEDYQDSVIDPESLVVVIEAGSPQGWERWTGRRGAFIGMTTFGASAPAEDLYRHFGITADAVVKAVKARVTL